MIPALLVIDVQKAIDHPKWRQHGGRNNPGAERKIARLLETWRERRWPVYHIRHDSTKPDSPYRPGQPGHEFKPESAPSPGETVIGKQSNSAFIGTNLEAELRSANHLLLVVCGVVTNNSVEATVRMAGNLGFETYLVEDACFTFAKPRWPAEEVHAMSLANLDGEYCRVIRADDAIAFRSDQ